MNAMNTVWCAQNKGTGEKDGFRPPDGRRKRNEKEGGSVSIFSQLCFGPRQLRTGRRNPPGFLFPGHSCLIGKLYTKDFFKTLLAGWGIGFWASILGLVLAYAFALPTAPLIVASLSLGFFSLLDARILKSPPGSPDDGDPASGRSGERKIPEDKPSLGR